MSDHDERRAPYDPMPHGPPEVGVGPWEGPWPEGEEYDAALLDELPQKGNYALRRIRIRRRQVDLVAEEDKAAARHTRHETRARGWRVLVHGMRFQCTQ